jgi:GNAT superfamily N-acetyltransferase
MLAYSPDYSEVVPRCYAVKSREFTVSDIRQTVRAILCDGFSWFNDQDQLVVERRIHQVRIYCKCARASQGCLDTTFLECVLDFDASGMWIGNLHVAAAYRQQGLGRALVHVAESIAGAMTMRDINVFPLQGSQSFWSKMGYTPKPTMTRVLCKDVFAERHLAAWEVEHQVGQCAAGEDSLHNSLHVSF